MRVLFLDIDGVLNSEQSAIYFNRLGHENGGFNDAFCPIALSNLTTILEELPDMKIVVSSTWRLGETLESMQAVLTKLGKIPPERVIGLTPVGRRRSDGGSCLRGDEIAEWLKNNPGVERFVIVDDDGDMGDLMDHLIQTKWRLGLMRDDAVKIINRFNHPWAGASGWDLTKLKDAKTVNHSIAETVGVVTTTYWGKDEPLIGAIVEDWALAKVVEVTDPCSFNVFVREKD